MENISRLKLSKLIFSSLTTAKVIIKKRVKILVISAGIFTITKDVKEYDTVKPLNSGHLRVFKNLSVIERCPLLGGYLKRIVTFET